MSSDTDLPLALKHDQVRASTAYPSAPGNFYSHVHVGGSARSQLGNIYNYGPTEDQQILQAMLQSLHYPEMGQRGSDVPDAGTDTFEWLFEDHARRSFHDSDESDEYEQEYLDDESQRDEGEAHGQEGWEATSEGELSDVESSYSEDQSGRDGIAVKLRSWLKDDEESVFWVTGKPGSGKSTFMKFLRDHDGTDELLREWAQDDHLIVADHFFWLPGTQLQKSFEGLARSLMHAILSSLGTDITSAKTICGKRRWSLTASHRPWSQSEFKRMFSNLGNISSIRVFLLIDGLDECCPQHSHDDLMDMLMGIVQRPNFKACLSSRPWSEFATRLGRSPSLRLDQITRLDMITYVTNKIHPATRDQELTAKELRELVSLIVVRADGVFLWVELVVRAVNVELKKGRGMSRVSSIMNDLPSELDDYFTMLIYERIDKTSGNISDTASVLSLAIQREEQRDLGRGYLQRYEFIDFWLLSRGALDIVTELPNTETPKYDQRQISVMLEQTRSFLEVASKDLLVLKHSHNCVDFLHRTVFDFLRNGSVNDAIRQRSPPHFHKSGFILQVTALRCTYNLMCSGISCGYVDRALGTIARLPCIDTTTRTVRNALATTCESLAIDHLRDTKSCFDEQHSLRPLLNVMKRTSSDGERAMGLTPYRYIRAIFRSWPHTALTMRLGDPDCYRTISDLKLRDLCSACTDIMYDCLYSGALPKDWMTPIEGLPREDYYLQPIKGTQSEDGPEHSICEFCKTRLPYSKDCGLKDTFFLFEKTAFETRIPKAELLTQNLIGSPTSNRQIAKLSSFELPWSILRRTDGLQALSATSDFQQFVWNRQKLRSVRSLLTTIRRRLSGFATDALSLCSGNMQKVCLSWIHEFIGPPAKRDRGLQCDGRSESLERQESVVVFLQPNRFPLFCDECYKRAAPQRDLGPLFVFTIRLAHDVVYVDGDFVLREGMDPTTVKAVLEIIAWYSATAPAYGLGWMVPSDTAKIQRALLAMSDATVDWE